MSLAFGTLFEFRMVSEPTVGGFRVESQITEQFGALGFTTLRGEPVGNRLTFKVAQDGFSSRQLARNRSVLVQHSAGKIEDLTITGEAAVSALLVNATEERISQGGGTTMGHTLRMVLTFEEVAT
jgi:hypothetical protein